MRALALLLVIPGAAVAIATVELTRVPTGGDAGRALAAWIELLRSAGRSFWIPSALLALAIGVLALADRLGDRRRRLLVACLVGLGVTQAAFAREVLIGYHPFSWHLGANVVFVAVAAGFAAAHVALLYASRRPRLFALGGALAALAALGLVRAHYALYVGLYPTLHQCVLHLSFVTVALGAALALRVPAQRPRARWALAPVALLTILLAVLEPPASAWARPAVVAHTELGRGAGVALALEEQRDQLLPRSAPSANRAIDPDPDAEARFARRSGLPRLDAEVASLDVLVVFSDATRYDRTSLARRDGPTPALARLAARSQVFERAYAPSNGTFPTMASFLSMTPLSWSPVDLYARHWRGALRPSRPNAAEAMRAAGRTTFWVGHDLEGSFSEHAVGLERGFDERVLVPERRGAEGDADVDRRIADRAIETIRSHGGARWLGVVFFISPHDDYRVHDANAPHDTPLERYDQELRAMDAQLARVIAAVDLEQTVVVFAGDHGEAFGEHGHRRHLSSVYEEQIHVPLVVHVPSMAPARHEAPTSLAYVLPWLLLRGSGPERRAASRVLREDLGPWMRELDGAVVSELIGPRRQAAALIYPEHTLVYDVFADYARLFDASDPSQEADLREREPARFERLLPLVQSYRRLRFGGRRFRFVNAPEDP